MAWIVTGVLALAEVLEATTYHTIIQGPPLDFVADETFPTSTPTRTAFATWDADWLFLGYQGEQVINPPPGRQAVWYFDTDPRPNPMSGAGTATAVSIGTQNWTLPFFADYMFRVWFGGAHGLYRWNGSAWVHVGGPTWFVSASGPSNPYIKAGVPRSMLGSPQQVYALGFLVSEETGDETTYGSWPNDSLVGGDGYKPAGQFAHWWGYTLGPGISPNDLAYHSLTLPVELMGFAVE